MILAICLGEIATMNRQQRRAAARQSKQGEPIPESAPTVASSNSETSRPSRMMRIFARLLLANWVIKRVHHPDLVAILLQIAQQVGRADAVARLTVKTYAASR